MLSYAYATLSMAALGQLFYGVLLVFLVTDKIKVLPSCRLDSTTTSGKFNNSLKTLFITDFTERQDNYLNILAR
ncbi:hypothetical protein RIVM261_028690 [Rivularia sp. IAM M-261]|nr:hypothetical protein CAL7716_012210 [Calothrix sp. PCC 7716]GJD17913.1 hypothetical protein RIVM261_028690 [Rivularia sp. IAM M-261]